MAVRGRINGESVIAQPVDDATVGAVLGPAGLAGYEIDDAAFFVGFEIVPETFVDVDFERAMAAVAPDALLFGEQGVGFAEQQTGYVCHEAGEIVAGHWGCGGPLSSSRRSCCWQPWTTVEWSRPTMAPTWGVERWSSWRSRQ